MNACTRRVMHEVQLCLTHLALSQLVKLQCRAVEYLGDAGVVGQHHAADTMRRLQVWRLL